MQPVRRRFTVDEYYALVPAGVLSERDRVELIEGEIIEMTPMGSPHASAVMRLNQHFSSRLQGQAIVLVQTPVRLGDFSEPEPDLALLRPRTDIYRDAHPGPVDVLLLIEVARSSLSYDRLVKLPLYARSGIAEVWIVDLAAQAVEVYRNPDSEVGYAESFVVGIGDSVAPLAFSDQPVEVASIVG